MQFMVFSDKMIDGVESIDRQHRLLIDILNSLYAIVLAKAKPETLDKVFEELARYTDQHFSHEEDLLARTGYPKLDEHRANHEALKRRIADYQASRRGGNDTILAADLLHFLKQWLNDHMMNEDKEACRHLNACGIR